MKALILLGTLKSPKEASNTETLTEFFTMYLEKEGVDCEVTKLAEYDIKPGTHTKIGADDWPAIYKKILAADIIIFATPIWWGMQSSLIQRVIERLDEVHDDLMKGKWLLQNKVAGIIMTGDSDGAQHIIGNLANFFLHIGLTLPALPTLSVLWSDQAKGKKPAKKHLLGYYRRNYAKTARRAAQNLVFLAGLLKKNPFPG